MLRVPHLASELRSPDGLPLQVALLFLVALVAAGCTGHRARHDGQGDCTPTGCFGCSDETQTSCWPLPYDPCSSQNDCRDGARCTSIGCCSACQTDDQCRQGELCNAGYCSPGSVHPDPVGDGGQTGSDLPGVLPCSNEGECHPGETCVSGSCTHSASCGIPRTLCTSSTDCGNDRVCLGGLCHASCSGIDGCPDGQLCSSGVCIDSASHGTACRLDGDCGTPSRCINAICHALCTTTGACRTGEFCDVGVCRADYRPASAR